MQFSLNEYLEELRPLMNVDCGTYTTDGIEYIASQFEEKYQAMSGWSVKRIDCGRAGIGLEVRNKPEAEQIDVMLIGHMDTVFPVVLLSFVQCLKMQRKLTVRASRT